MQAPKHVAARFGLIVLDKGPVQAGLVEALGISGLQKISPVVREHSRFNDFQIRNIGFNNFHVIPK